MSSNSTLIEPGVKQLIQHTLKEYRNTADSKSTIFLNITLCVILMITVAIFLYMNYKGKPSKEELKLREQKKHEYIMKKLQQYNYTTQHRNNNMITDLPNWGDHPELATLQKMNHKNV
jgi:hypothetical protein